MYSIVPFDLNIYMPSYKGLFRPRNIQKYKGDFRQIMYRSLWELKVMNFFDLNSNIVEWSNEEIVIPYLSPIDGRMHRYFPDFWVKMRDRAGNQFQMLIEVKPYAQTKPPQRGKKRQKTYINEQNTYDVNQAKWNAASEYCKDRNWKFEILTEKDIYGNNG